MTKEQWKQRQIYYETKLKELIIPVDPNPAIVKSLLSRIDALFTEARLDLANFEVANDDIDRKIYVIEKECSDGKNDVERRRAGVVAVKNFKLPDGRVEDLWEIQRIMNGRYVYIKSVVDILHQKQARLITISGVMKIESQLAPHSNAGWDAGRS